MNHLLLDFPKYLPTIIGLIIVIVGPVILLTPAAKLLGKEEKLVTKLLGQFVLWVFLGLIIVITVFWPLSSIGLRLQWQSIFWGLLFAAIFIFLISRFIFWLPQKLGLPGFKGGFIKLANLPISWPYHRQH